jgi:hypothetical protein
MKQLIIKIRLATQEEKKASSKWIQDMRFVFSNPEIGGVK